MVKFAPNLGWIRAPFTELLSERLGQHVVTGNDANLGVLAEHLRGAAVGDANVAFVSGSVGIGGGFLSDGRLLGGANGYAGEIGHLQVDASGGECRCGAVGCWELKVGENRLLQLAGRLPGGGPEAVAEVITAAAGGEARAVDALADVARWIGVGIRAVVNIFNPDVVVLGGCLAQVLEVEAERINQVVDRSVLLSPRGEVRIVGAALGMDAPLIGAAELAFEPLLDHPQLIAAAPTGTG